MFKYFFLIFSLVLSLQTQAMPKIGESAPEVETEEFSLKNCKSKFVVLYFYPKDGTANCTIEAQKFAAYYQDFQKLGAEIVGVSNDIPESHKAFAEKLQLPFTLISDDGSLIKSYDVSGIIWTQRATFLIDNDRNVAYIWRSVNVATHAEEVLKKIQEFSGQSSAPVVASEKSTTLQKESEDIKGKLEQTLKEVDSLRLKLEKKLKEIERNMK
jgi:peroxiredoxin Q/BCP